MVPSPHANNDQYFYSVYHERHKNVLNFEHARAKSVICAQVRGIVVASLCRMLYSTNRI